MTINIILYVYFVFGYALLALIVSLMFLSIFNRFKEHKYVLDENFRPSVSLIVPAHNEADVIERTINSFLNTNYEFNSKELILVNDGSTDDTEKIIRKYAYAVIENDVVTFNEQNINFKNITLVNRGIGGNGKAHASNAGAKQAKGEILFFIDADVQVRENIFTRGVRHFSDKNVGGVAGYIEITKNKTILNDFISFESILAQKVMRAGFNMLGVQYVVPGGCAVFRKDIWKRVWGYTGDSLAEDTDLTWKVLMQTRKEIRFDDSVSVRADEPQTLLSLWNQRVRWARGNLEVTMTHWYKVGKKNYGKGATHLFPFWLASTLMPIVFIFNIVGVLLAVFLQMDLKIILGLNIFLSLSFFLSFIFGIFAGRGRSILAGFLSPGMPMLLVLISNILWKNGVSGMLGAIGFNIKPELITLVLALWIISTIPLTYLMIKISKKYEAFAQGIQLVFLGYWSLVVASTLQGYILEARGKKREWIRTVR